jgi:endonuclease YncB( thermonuclease family)
VRPGLVSRLALLSLAAAAPATANWIVFARGGMQEIRGVIQVRGKQVVYASPNGTLLSARLEDVDVPSTAFLTWQVGDGRRLPPSAAPKSAAPGQPAPALPPCVDVRVDSVANSETLKIDGGKGIEVVHLEGVDGPDLRHKFPDLDWYGRVAIANVEALAPAGSKVCVSEDVPPRRDEEGHRLIYVRTRTTSDLGGEIIRRGLAVARSDAFSRRDAYRELERGAQRDGRGHWGPESNEASLAIAINALGLTGGPGPAPYAGVRTGGRGGG